MTKRFLTFFAAALLVTAVPAFASTIMDEDTQALPVDANTTLNLSKFDTTLGTLTNVWVQIQVRLSGASVELDNDATAAQDGTGRVLNAASSLTSSVTLLKVGFDTINNGDLALNAYQVFNLAGTTGDPCGFTATHLGDYAHWQPGTLTSGDSGDIFSAVWGGYQGTGYFTVTVNSTYLTSATFVGNDGFFQGNTPNGELYGKVIYTYDPVPEPATITLLCVGAFALLRRKK
ncbi:MAG: choice-of-anchor E domain-containing protein [Chloroflexi bacterium]|nr:choice-of-anchor E domain-containing protein [Chloroflexota bacterium]